MRRALLLCMLLLTVLPAHAVGPEIIVDKKPLALDRPVLESEGHILIPLRGLFTALHAEVTWDAAIDTVYVRRERTWVTLRTGEYVATVNGHILELDVPGRVVDVHVGNRWEPTLYVPLRFVAQALGATVTWSAPLHEVDIASNYTEPHAVVRGPVQVLEAPAAIPIDDNRLIVQISLNPPDTLVPGSPLLVSVDGTPGAHATFDFGDNHGVAMTEEKPGHYVGSAMLQAKDVGSGQFLVVHLVTADGHQATRTFPLPVPVVERQSVNPPVIGDVSDNGPGPLFAGEHFLMGARGTPGVQAWFTLMGVNYLMPEVHPGYYRADYVVRSGEIAENEAVTVTFLSTSGARTTVVAPQKVTLVGR